MELPAGEYVTGSSRPGGIRPLTYTLDALSPLEEKAARDFSLRVREKFGPRVVDMRIFGSRARRDAREESDMDIWVLLDVASLEDRGAVSDIAVDVHLEMVLSFFISPRVMSVEQFEKLRSLERLLPEEIERDGIPL